MKITFSCIAVLFLLMSKSVLGQTCSDDPASCTPPDLCKQATEKFDNQLYWLADEGNPYLKLARKFSLDCGALAAVSECERDAATCTIVDLCKTATTLSGQKKIWNPERPKHGELAISFGMNCDVEISEQDVVVESSKAKPLTAAQKCDNNISVCTQNEICSSATMIKNSRVAWSTVFTEYVSEAKRRGLSCDVVEATVQPEKICANDVNHCTTEQLCNRASWKRPSGPVWNTASIASPYVKEAKRRGLTCGVGKVVAKPRKKQCDRSPEVCDERRLCQLAVGNQNWETRSNYQKHVAEAKRRGLTCGVQIVATSENTCFDDEANCTKDEICKAATLNRSGGKIWDIRSVVSRHVAEAKRRGLSCGVEEAIIKDATGCPEAIMVKMCTPKQVCSSARLKMNGKYVWNTQEKYKKYTVEAKRRGLTCGVEGSKAETALVDKPISFVKECKANLNNCSGANLCEIASYRPLSSGFKYRHWKLGNSYQPFRKEAQSRGLTCGVGEPTPELSQNAKNNMPSEEVMLLLKKVPVKDLESIDVFRLMQHPSCPDEQPFYNCFKENRFILGEGDANPEERIWLGYYLSNKVWVGFEFKNNEYLAYTFEGNYFPTPSCSQSASNPKWNDWYQCREGDKYRALDGDPENKGRMITVKRTLPNGTTKNRQEKHGRWEYIWPSGDKYAGQYKDDQLHGQGTYTYPNGNKYVGEWKDGQFHGQGTYTWAAGDEYVGEYKEGQQHGQGTYTWAAGHKYVGEFKDDTRNGQGTSTYADGGKYVGEWKDDKKNGQGTFTWASGNKYVGEYKDDKRNGQGFFFFPDGRTEFCTYADGKGSNCIGKNANDVAVNLKSQFSALPTSKRKKIQANLKRRNLYTSSIDGQWGRGTLIALVEFSSKNLGTVDLQSSSMSKKLLDAVLQ